MQEFIPDAKSVEEFEDSVYEYMRDNKIREKASNLLIVPTLRKLKAQTKIQCELADVPKDYFNEYYQRVGGIDGENALKYIKETLKGENTIFSIPEGREIGEYLDSLSDEDLKKEYDVYILESFKRGLLCFTFGEQIGVDFSEAAYEKEVEILVNKFGRKLEEVKMRFTYCGFKYVTAETQVFDFLLDYFKKNNVKIVEA